MSTITENLNTIKGSINRIKTALNLPANTPLEVVTTNIEQGGGSVKSNIYRVGSIAERDAITDMVEGDMCVIHYSSVENVNVDSRFQIATFPEVVVLDTAMTDYVDVRYRAVDESVMFACMGQLDSSNFMMDCYTDSGPIRIEYTSEDGITYTRTDTTGNPVDFGTEIYYEMPDMWNGAIGNFIQIGGIDFDGMFEYKNGVWEYAKININTTSEYIYRNKKVYTDNGIITGTITDNPSTNFDDINSKIYAELTEKYNSIDYIVAPEDSTRYFAAKNLYTIPIKSECIPLVDTSNTINMSWMFDNCTLLTTIPLIDTSKVTDMSSMFNNCTSLTSLPLLDTSKVTDMKSMFCACKSLTTIPLINTSNVTNMADMFQHCNSLTEIPLIDTSKVTTTRQMFYYCKSLSTIPLIDTSNVLDMSFMFQDCNSLTEIPLIDTSKVTTTRQMFGNCTSLTTIPLIDTSKVTDMSSMFNNCTSLSDESLNNILAMAKNSKVSSTAPYLGLNTEQRERIKSLSNYDAFIAAGWTN